MTGEKARSAPELSGRVLLMGAARCSGVDGRGSSPLPAYIRASITRSGGGVRGERGGHDEAGETGQLGGSGAETSVAGAGFALASSPCSSISAAPAVASSPCTSVAVAPAWCDREIYEDVIEKLISQRARRDGMMSSRTKDFIFWGRGSCRIAASKC